MSQLPHPSGQCGLFGMTSLSEGSVGFSVCVLSVQIEKCKHQRLLDMSSGVHFPLMLRFFCGWRASLFTTRILDLEFLSESLIVALRSVQPVTVDSKVK